MFYLRQTGRRIGVDVPSLKNPSTMLSLAPKVEKNEFRQQQRIQKRLTLAPTPPGLSILGLNKESLMSMSLFALGGAGLASNYVYNKIKKASKLEGITTVSQAKVMAAIKPAAITGAVLGAIAGYVFGNIARTIISTTKSALPIVLKYGTPFALVGIGAYLLFGESLENVRLERVKDAGGYIAIGLSMAWISYVFIISPIYKVYFRKVSY